MPFKKMQYLLNRTGQVETVGSKFSDLATAQSQLPVIRSLDDDLNWAILQSAIDEAGLIGDAVHLPPGDYALTKGLVVNETGFFLRGQGTKASYSGPSGGAVLTFKGLDSPAFTAHGEFQPPSSRKVFGLESLFIRGYNCTSDGISLRNNQRYGTFENVQIRGFGGAGLKLDHTWVGTYNGLTLRENKVGVHFTGSSVLAQDFHSCYIAHNKLSGLLFDQSVASCINFFGGQIEGNGQGAKDGAQLIVGPFNRGINIHGTWFEWGNHDNNPLIRLPSEGKAGSISSVHFMAPFFDQRNEAPLVIKENVFGDISLSLSFPTWPRRNGKDIIGKNVPINGTRFVLQDI